MKKLILAVKHLISLYTVFFCCFSLSNYDCYFLFYNNTNLDSQTSNLESQLNKVLKLPSDTLKRSTLWSQINSEPETYIPLSLFPEDSPEKKEFLDKIVKPLIFKKPHTTEDAIVFESYYRKDTGDFITVKASKAMLTDIPHKPSAFVPVDLSQTTHLTLTPAQPQASIQPQVSTQPQASTQPQKPAPLKKLTENQALQKAIKIEHKINSLLEKIEMQRSENEDQLQKMSLSLHKMKEQIYTLSQSQKDWNVFNKQIENIEKKFNAIVQKKQIKTINELLTQPAFLSANHPYSVELKNDKTFYIIFNQKVVNFLSKLQSNQIKLILEKIKKGFISGPRQTGLKILNQNGGMRSKYKSSLVEIKTMGSEIGHIRVTGFIDKNNIHFSSVISESDHSKTTAKKHLKENAYQSSLK